MGGPKGTQQSQTNQTQTYTPAGYSQIASALAQGQAAAQLPFNIPQAPVAGFSPDQLSAFQNVNNAQGSAQPYYNQAQSFFSPQGAQQFYNPMASAVNAQLNNTFGQQQQQATGQLTQAAGGVGADRIAVGQGLLANQQALASGQVNANLYSQAQQQAQAAGQNMAGLGNNVLNSQLTGAQAQLGTGGLQQQLSQAQLNSPYQLALAQAAFPYQQAQFNAGITGALAPALGGTTTGQGNTTSQYNPSLTSQLLGGGLLAGSLFLNRGGAIRNPYADGGAVDDDPIDISKGYIPVGNLQAAQSHIPTLNLSAPTGSATGKGSSSGSGSTASLMKLASLLGGPTYGGGSIFGGDAYGGSAANPLPGLSASDYGAGFADGGEVDDDTRQAGLEMLRAAMIDKGYKPAEEPFRLAGPQAVQDWKDSTPLPTSFAPNAASAPDDDATAASPAVSPAGYAASPAAAADAPAAAAAPSDSDGSPLRDYAKHVLSGPNAILLQAGLGAFTPSGIAGGLQAGLKNYQGEKTVDQHAQELEQQAKKELDQYTKMTPYQQAQINIAKAKLAKDDSDNGALDSDSAHLAAEVYVKTGQMPPLGYGKIGAQNRAIVWQHVQQIAKSKGLSGDDIAAAKADFAGQTAGARTAGTRGANIDIAVAEAQKTIPLALDASLAVPRTEWVPWNRAVQAVQTGTSSPELAKFVAANRAVITAYAQAMSRTGVTTVHAQQAAEELLSTATSQKAYTAVLGQLQAEMGAAQSAPEVVRQRIQDRISGRGAAPGAAAPNTKTIGGKTYFQQNGQWFEQ